RHNTLSIVKTQHKLMSRINHTHIPNSNNQNPQVPKAMTTLSKSTQVNIDRTTRHKSSSPYKP
ncbi:hypothetical protein V9W47_01825, partial [Staphylococcus aureus]|uniref:hypothetical protein n=1 Tax=Staphylococcus aureus TaxID=1280 RepID=UPI003D272676